MLRCGGGPGQDPAYEGAAAAAVQFSAWMVAVRALQGKNGVDLTPELATILELARVRPDSYVMRQDVVRVASYYLHEWTGTPPLPTTPSRAEAADGMKPWTRKRGGIHRRLAMLIVALAGVAHLSYLASIALRVASGMPGRSSAFWSRWWTRNAMPMAWMPPAESVDARRARRSQASIARRPSRTSSFSSGGSRERGNPVRPGVPRRAYRTEISPCPLPGRAQHQRATTMVVKKHLLALCGPGLRVAGSTLAVLVPAVPGPQAVLCVFRGRAVNEKGAAQGLRSREELES